MTLAYYCLSALDLLDVLEAKSKLEHRKEWRDWIWKQQICKSASVAARRLLPRYTAGEHGTGFRPGPSTSVQEDEAIVQVLYICSK